MTWPPELGKPLPRADKAAGVREKLANYSLDETHEVGGPKARGFARILGITIADIDYLEATIRNGILVTPVSSIRKGALRGLNCVVELPVRGLGTKTRRMVNARTVWELATKDAVPRLVSAYLKP